MTGFLLESPVEQLTPPRGGPYDDVRNPPVRGRPARQQRVSGSAACLALRGRTGGDQPADADVRGPAGHRGARTRGDPLRLSSRRPEHAGQEVPEGPAGGGNVA